MNEKKTKIVMVAIIGVLLLSCISLGICFKMTKGKPYETGKIENNDIDESKNVEDDKEECNKQELFFKSSKQISKNYSSLIDELDYTVMTRYYCYNDICANLEKQLLDIYKDENPDSNIKSGFADYSVKLSNGKLLETIDGESKIIDGIKNVKSVIAHFNVSNGIELFYLDSNSDLYNYKRAEKESTLIYSNVKDFTIIEGNDYLSSILPSEGSNITVALHTKDNKFIISYYGYNKFINIKDVDYSLLQLENENIRKIYLSNSKENKYEKHNNKEIIVKELFIDSNKIYILTNNDELLVNNLDSNYCKDNYELYKNIKIKELEYEESKVKVTFENNESININYTNKFSL